MEILPTGLPKLLKPSRDLLELRKFKLVGPTSSNKTEYFRVRVEMSTNISDMCRMLLNFVSNMLRVFEVFGRFRGYRKVREACRKNFHLVAPLKTSVARFYDQKTQKVHDYEHHDY